MDLSRELWQLTARELYAGYEARAFSARDAVASALRRIEATNPGLNAICTLTAESALAAAAESDRRVVAGEMRPLEGIPLLVKDNIPTAGVRTTFGSRIFEHNVPDGDAVSVERAKRAGAIVIGKTNTPEFAYEPNTYNELFGVTRNPWDIRCSAGGSSGGNGSALAAGMAPLAIGTDLGGSIRTPSAYCGTAGLRGAPGRVPLFPADFAWDTMVAHVQGPMARTVADVGMLLAVLAGPDDRDPSSIPGPGVDYRAIASSPGSMRGVRVAFSASLGGLVPVDEGVRAATLAAVARLRELGCVVEEADPDTSGLKELIAGVRAYGQTARLAGLLERHRDVMGARIIAQIEGASRFDVRAIAEAERLRGGFYQKMRAFLERFEFLVTPTCGITAFRLDEALPSVIGGKSVENFNETNMCNQIASPAGLPALSLPSGLAANGMPAGLQIVGRRLREDRVLELGAALEALVPPLGIPAGATAAVPAAPVLATSAARY